VVEEKSPSLVAVARVTIRVAREEFVSLMALRRNDVALRDAPTKPLQEVSVSHTAQR
jgi:hypothetical protein